MLLPLNAFPHEVTPVLFSQTTLKSPLPSRPIAPAPSGLGHLTVPPKVSGHVTVSMDPSVPQASAIPVATISGQQVRAQLLYLFQV